MGIDLPYLSSRLLVAEVSGWAVEADFKPRLLKQQQHHTSLILCKLQLTIEGSAKAGKEQTPPPLYNPAGLIFQTVINLYSHFENPNSMIGTLSLPSATCLLFSTENSLSFAAVAGSDRKMSFAGRNPAKSAILAAVTEAASEVATRRHQSNLYEVLKVKRNASPTEIKTAYRSLAKLYHPDAFSQSLESDGREFIEIHNAYATLSDPSTRAIYDLTLSIGSGSGVRSFGHSYGFGYYSTRRWETDQCW
ncbi:unnamed protein product [Ilex paraguariensis]|uniref:J domain-containing protein n=1 Tax=Ilex paraguariensis TaxID=185542 RepID=A0ABC8RV98_9AQUA